MTLQEKIRRHLASHPRRATHDGHRVSVRESVPTRDTKIYAEQGAHNPDVHGLHWVGDLEPIGRALRQMSNVSLRDRLTKAIVDAAAPVGHPSRTLAHEDPEALDELGAGPAGSLSTATPTDMQDANRNYWDSISNRYRAGARDSAAAIAAPGTIRAVALAQAAFWASQPTAPGRKWGQR